MAVSAFYQDPSLEAPVEITVRWHTKLSLAGKGAEDFEAAIVEGINRLVFQDTELTSEGREARDLPALPEGLEALDLVHGGVVTVPDFGVSFHLDHMEEPDGPLNIYWSVAQQ